jgi:hypothetical protein
MIYYILDKGSDEKGCEEMIFAEDTYLPGKARNDSG